MTGHVLMQDLKANSKLTGWWGVFLGWLIAPGFRAVLHYRLAKRTKNWRIGALILRILWLRNASVGVYFAPSCVVGGGLRLPHPATIVIGDHTIIGANVTLYQGVTLGRRSSEGADYPVIGDNVVIYAGACVLGRVTVGDGAIIGANAVVMEDVPPGATAVGVPARIIQRSSQRHMSSVIQQGLVAP